MTSSDPPHHISVKSQLNEPYINIHTHMASVVLSSVIRSWTPVKAVYDACQPSAVVLIDVVPMGLLHVLTYTDT